MSNPVGRPPLFKSKEELQAKIDAYFQYADDTHRPYTLSSLAYFLDCDTDTLRNYTDKSEFIGTIKKAKVRIEASKAEKLESKDYATAGLIFDLVNNHGFTNRQTLAGDAENPLFPVSKEQNDAAVTAALEAAKHDAATNG